MDSDSTQFHWIPLNQISINPYQPRKHFSEEELNELAASLQSIGMIQPLIVRKLEENRFELVAGERRLKAAKQAGFEKVPAIVRDYKTLEAAEAALIENLQRVDLNPIEIANAMRSIMLQFELKQEDVGKKMGKKRSTIANYLRLLSLPTTIQESLSSGKITVGHAKVILSLDDTYDRLVFHEKILSSSLTVRESEAYVEKLKGKSDQSPIKNHSYNVHLEEIANRLQHNFGTKVCLVETGNKKGRIIIDYYNYDDLDRLLQCMLPNIEIK